MMKVDIYGDVYDDYRPDAHLFEQLLNKYDKENKEDEENKLEQRTTDKMAENVK